MDDEVSAVDGGKKRDLRLDVKETEVQGVGMGDEVSITLTGKVKSLSAPYEYENAKGKTKKESYGSVSLEVQDVKISAKSDNEFEELSKEDDE